MSERNAKRARQRESGQNNGTGGAFPRYGGGGSSGGGGGGAINKLAGCHLEVKPATTHLFLGQPIDVEVRLLDDEDIVQHTTVDINVSLTGGNGKVETRWILPLDLNRAAVVRPCGR